MNENVDADADGAFLAGLVDRVRGLLLALDRRDRLEDASELAGWLQQQTRERLDDIAREMLLRVLRRAGDPVNYRILGRLDVLNAVNTADLMQDTALDRVALSERLNDLRRSAWSRATWSPIRSARRRSPSACAPWSSEQRSRPAEDCSRVSRARRTTLDPGEGGGW